MISLWTVILIGISLGLLFAVINIALGIILGKKSAKAFEEHMNRMYGDKTLNIKQ
jgi:hypothetical protein